MERPEFNQLRKMAKCCPNLIVDEMQNALSLSIYDGGVIKKVVMIMKCDTFGSSKKKVEKIMQEASRINERKNNKK